jgi:hypothetical protein
MRILFFLLFPVFLSAQINRAYGVIEIGSFPTSSATGPKFAYRPVDSSFYRWVSGNTWVKVVEPSIAPDTLYLKQLSGTTALVNGDTIDISTYFLKTDTTSAFASYLKRPVGWGLSLLSGKYPLVDSSKVATRYHVGANFFPLQGGTLTGTGGAGFIGFPSQVTAPGTPASGLNVYAQGSSFNWKGTDGYERQFASTLTGGRTYTLPNVSGTFALGTGTIDQSVRWSATNTLAAGNITDNGARLIAGLPFQLKEYSLAGLPTGTTKDMYWVTSAGPAWYQGSRLAYVPEFTFTRGTQNRIPYPNSNGQYTESANLTYTGTRFQTGGSIRLGYQNTTNDTASIEKVIDVNSKIVRLNNPGSSGGYKGGFVFRGGNNGTLSSANTFRIMTNSATVPGAVFVGDVSEGGASSAVNTTNVGVLNKITSLTAYDMGINLNPQGANMGTGGYDLSTNKSFGIFIGANSTNNFANMSTTGTYGVFMGYQYQPTAAGWGSSWVFTAKNESSVATELLRLQGKDGNVCLGCTSAVYKLHSTSTGAYGLARGTVAERPTIVTSTTPFRYNTDSTALEYGESVGVWRQLATRAYARSLVSGLSTTWLKTELEAGRDVDITGGANTDFRLRSNTRMQVDGRFKIGADSSFIHAPAQDTTMLKGSVRVVENSDGIKINKKENPYWSSDTIPLIVSGRYDANWVSNYYFNPFGYLEQESVNTYGGEPRLVFKHAKGTSVGAKSRVDIGTGSGNIFFQSYNGSDYYQGAFFGVYNQANSSSGEFSQAFVFGIDKSGGLPQVSSNWRFHIDTATTTNLNDFQVGGDLTGVGSKFKVFKTGNTGVNQDNPSAQLHVTGIGTTTGKTLLLEDSGGADILTVTDNKLIQMHGYGTPASTATALSKTLTNYGVGFATDGTVTSREVKRDTTVYVTDTDLDWSAAITTAQIASRYNRVIFLMTTTAAAGSNSDLTLHTPDINLMQVEYLIRSTDEAGGFTNTIQFGSNNAVASDNALASSYTPSPGQGVGIRAGLRSGTYKYWYY